MKYKKVILLALAALFLAQPVAQAQTKAIAKYALSKLTKKKSIFSWEGYLSYGMLSWSTMSGADDLFSSPDGAYSTKFTSGASWNFGIEGKWDVASWADVRLGLGYESNVFRLSEDVNWHPDVLNTTSHAGLIYLDPAVDVKKAKVVARYITVPVTVNFVLSKKMAVNFAAIGGINFRTSHTGFKRNYSVNGMDVAESWGTEFKDFKPVKLDLRVGIALWDKINIYAKQAVTPLFKTDTEREVYPFSFGVSLGI